MNQFFLGTFPYIALSVLLIGSLARYERDPYTWKSSSSQLLRRRMLTWGSNLFHVGILVVETIGCQSMPRIACLVFSSSDWLVGLTRLRQ